MYCTHCGNEISADQAYCPSCGAQTGNKQRTCPRCGKVVPDGAAFCTECGTSLNSYVPLNITTPAPISNTNGIMSRSIVSAILLSIITCGIYGIYWFIVLTDDMNKLSARENDTSGAMAFLLILVTCGLYSIYWAYKMGEKRDCVANENASSNIIYLVLSLFGLGIVVYALVQDTINKAIEKR